MFLVFVKILPKPLLLFVIGLFLVCCESNKNNVQAEKLSNPKDFFIEDIFADNCEVKYLDFKNSSKFKISEKDVVIGTDNICLRSKNEIILVNRRFNGITIIDSNKKVLKRFSIKGRGLGFCNFIHSAAVNNNQLLFYDSSFRKFLFYSFKGNLIEEVKNSYSELPYSINSLFWIDKNILAVGITSDGWIKYKNYKLYPNTFLFNLKDKYIVKRSIFSSLINQADKEDVVFHPDINELKISVDSYKNNYFIFDRLSGEIYSVVIKDKQIFVGGKYILPRDYFKIHKGLKYSEYNDFQTNKADIWVKEASFLMNVFTNRKHIIFYIANNSGYPNPTDFLLLFYNRVKQKVDLIYKVKEHFLLKFIKEDCLGFIGYEPEDELNNEITLFTFKY